MLRKTTLTIFFILFASSIMAQSKELHIFGDSVKIQCPIVCDFIERYVAECLSWNAKNYTLSEKMSYDKVSFFGGNIQSLLSLPDNIQYTLTRYDDRVYEAVWTNDSIILRMTFPIQYELLLGKTRRELEYDLEQDILDVRDTASYIQRQLLMYDSIVYFTVPQQNYYIPELTNTCYYMKHEGGFCLILDTAYMEYSIRNIVLSPSELNPIINVDQRLYGNKQKKYTVTLGQWFAYCQKEHLKLYAALKNELEDAYEVVVVAENKDLAYNHLLTMKIPRNFMTDERTLWKTEMRVFIPTHNLKDMYKQY